MGKEVTSYSGFSFAASTLTVLLFPLKNKAPILPKSFSIHLHQRLGFRPFAAINNSAKSTGGNRVSDET